MKYYVLMVGLLCLVGCTPKRKNKGEVVDEFIRPVYNSGDINNAIDASHGEQLNNRSKGAGAKEVKEYNNTSAQNIIMYSSMHKEQDAKKLKNCFKSQNASAVASEYKSYYHNISNNTSNSEKKHINRSSSIDEVDDYFNEEDRQMKEMENLRRRQHLQETEKKLGHGKQSSYNRDHRFKDIRNNNTKLNKKKRVYRNKNSNKKYCILYVKKEN